jgi:hypothetical protein
MHFLAGVAATIADAFRRFIAPLLRAIFGQIRWTPPPWLLGAVGSLRSWRGRAFNWLAARRAANPAGFWLTTFALLAFIIGGYAGWQWYEHLPQPYYLQVSVTRPGPTPLEPNAPPIRSTHSSPAPPPGSAQNSDRQPLGSSGLSWPNWRSHYPHFRVLALGPSKAVPFRGTREKNAATA